MKTISEKKKLISDVEKEMTEKPKLIKRYMESLTFEDAVNQTIKYLIDMGENTTAIDLNTVYDYANRIDMYIYDFFPKNYKLSKIDDNRIKEFVNYMFNRKRKGEEELLSISTVKRTYSALSWVVKYCSEIANPPLIKENYLNKIIFKTLIPKGRDIVKKKNKSHTLDEVQRLIDTLNDKANIRLKTMINIMLDVGCRDEECLGLKMKNVDFTTGKIYYQNAVTSKISKKYGSKHSGTRVKELKSRHSYRDNYLTPTTLKHLNNYIKFKNELGLSIDEDSYIFTIWSDDTILSPITFADEYKHFRIKYGFSDFPMYDIRHTVSNLLLESGMSPKDVAQYIGNTPRTLLESYTDIREETEQKIVGIIGTTIRDNKRKSFSIDDIAYVLNCDGQIDNKRAFDILDFFANRKINEDEVPIILEFVKEQILNQNPDLKTFCDTDENIIKAKVEAYKIFNNSSIELLRDSNYLDRSLKL